MPRKPRIYLAGVPSHVVQRGNHRNTCFFAKDDYRFQVKRGQRAIFSNIGFA